MTTQLNTSVTFKRREFGNTTDILRTKKSKGNEEVTDLMHYAFGTGALAYMDDTGSKKDNLMWQRQMQKFTKIAVETAEFLAARNMIGDYHSDRYRKDKKTGKMRKTERRLPLSKIIKRFVPTGIRQSNVDSK